MLIMTIEMEMNNITYWDHDDGFDCDDDDDDDDININNRPSSRAEKNWLQIRSMRPECMGYIACMYTCICIHK